MADYESYPEKHFRSGNGTCLRGTRHRFERHVGIKIFNKTGMAWIQLSMVAGADDAPELWICVRCGEKGYEVPA